MNVQFIENKLCENSLVRQSIVVGSNKPYLAALIEPNIKELKQLLINNEKEYLLNIENEGLFQQLEVRSYYCDIILSVNKEFTASGKIERFAIVQFDSIFDNKNKIENKCNNVKNSRMLIEEKHKKLIESFYFEIPPGVG